MDTYKENFNKALRMYENGISLTQIGKELGINRKRLSKDFKKLGIEIIQNNQKHLFNQNIFKTIDTEEKAYWLGFLYADGYICNRNDGGKHIELALAEYDFEHLLKFKEFMNATNDIQYKESANAYRICIYSKELVNDLINLGCIPNKSLILKFPTKEQVPENLIHHFMRGYFDGDGCLSTTHNQKSFSVIGTFEFLNKYEEYLLQGINKNKPNKRLHDPRHNENTYSIKYVGNIQCKKIFDFLYKDATVYLNRKYDKF